MLDKNGKVVYASSSHEKVLGFPAKKFEGDSILELIHSEDIRKIETQFSNMVETKTPCQVELRYKHAKGGDGSILKQKSLLSMMKMEK